MIGAASRVLEHAGGKILAETRGGTGVLTFNHPERRNAMTL